MIEHTVRVKAGRVLLALEDGDLGGKPIFALHGTPGCRLAYPPLVAHAQKNGIRLISYDRPGYGGSTAQSGRQIGDVAADVAAIADALGVDRFGVWGFSGGGAPALGCAALLGRRVVGAACLSGVAPYPAEGLDWLAGMGELNVEDFLLMFRDRPAWEKKCEEDRKDLLRWTPKQLEEGWASLLSAVDQKALTGTAVDFLVRQAHEGLRPGAGGIIDDTLSIALPWGFELEHIRVPVQIWHGEQDRFVPVSHGEWLAARIPDVDAHIEPHQGHVTVFLDRVPVAQSWLASKF